MGRSYSELSEFRLAVLTHPVSRPGRVQNEFDLYIGIATLGRYLSNLVAYESHCWTSGIGWGDSYHYPGVRFENPGMAEKKQTSIRSNTTKGVDEKSEFFGTQIRVDNIPLSNNANLQL